MAQLKLFGWFPYFFNLKMDRESDPLMKNIGYGYFGLHSLFLGLDWLGVNKVSW